jgi:hypothetical protein
MPFLAIARYELRTMAGSWLVRLWLGTSVLLTMILLLSKWSVWQSALLTTSLLVPYLVFPWFFVVMVLGVEPVAGARVEALVDGILSRPVTRWEYLLASWAARVVVVLGVYLVVVVPASALVCLARRHVPDDSITLYGYLATLGLVGLVLVFQVSLALLAGTFLGRPMLAMVILVSVWYPVHMILDTFALEEFSPISLCHALPTLLRQPWQADSARPSQFDLDTVAEQITSMLGGVSDTPSQHRAKFFERTRQDEFSLFRVGLGYGVPTLVAVGLALLHFTWKDL